MEKQFSINGKTTYESNLFIRALLNELSNYFDRFIWSYLYEKIHASNFVILNEEMCDSVIQIRKI